MNFKSMENGRKEAKMEKILDFAVNPAFCNNDSLKTLVNKGFPAHYMSEDQKNPKIIWTMVLEKKS